MALKETKGIREQTVEYENGEKQPRNKKGKKKRTKENTLLGYVERYESVFGWVEDGLLPPSCQKTGGM